jgi:hypothetical protein
MDSYTVTAYANTLAGKTNSTSFSVDVKQSVLVFYIESSTTANNSNYTGDYISISTYGVTQGTQPNFTKLIVYDNAMNEYQNFTCYSASCSHTFTGLAPGKYYFKGTLCSNIGLCNETELREVLLLGGSITAILTPPTPNNNHVILDVPPYNITVNATAYVGGVPFKNLTLFLYNDTSLVDAHTCNTPVCAYDFTLNTYNTYYVNATACTTTGVCDNTLTRTIIFSSPSSLILTYSNPTPFSFSISRLHTYQRLCFSTCQHHHKPLQHERFI